MKFHRLVETSSSIAGRSARLAKIEALREWLSELLESLDSGSLSREQIGAAVSILAGTLPYGRIGVGWARIQESLPDERPADESPRLELVHVLESFRAIKNTSGKGSTGRKIELLGQLFEAATLDERRFLVRLLMQDLRQGALEGVMIDAVARAAGVPLGRVRRAAMLSGSAVVASIAALTEGEQGLAEFRVDLFRPLQPMLAQPAETLDAAIAIMESIGGSLDAAPCFVVEAKIDGARVQVHRQDDRVEVYSRRLRNVTASVPEVVEAVLALDARELILDGEAFALRPDGSAQPFQVTMRRFGRSQNVSKLRNKLPLTALWFDCLYFDGNALIDRPAASRRAILQRIAPEAVLVPAQEIRLSRAEDENERRSREEGIEKAAHTLERLLQEGHEGVMVKDLQSTYEAGKRGKAWLKVKPTHTLDLVVLAAEWGHGRRRGWLSNLHLGARDDSSESGFVMLGKTFKGLTDDLLRWQTEQLLAREVRREGITVYVRPELVVEIVFNDVQTSPQYPGGVALRFARVKNYREDKGPSEADTLETVKEIQRLQNARTASGPAR